MEYIKVRMDEIKCAQYKTLQPELPTRKFLFTDEKESMHNLKLLLDDASELDKATTFHGENVTESNTIQQEEKEEKEEEEKEKEEEEEEEEEDVEEVRKAMTGMFRDNIRRIDLVLVVEEDINELMNDIKIDFLSYILRAGLEVEIEPGVMRNHENLTFIKIHAPDSVLEKYGKFFGTKRYFAETRYHYMEQKTNNYEKEWVKFVRDSETPKGYSNYERSIIVYKMLLHLSFGDNANYYGIERLLNRKVIIDVFALHDGPYFITPDQTISGSNARQILNYYWSKIRNVYRQQPIHLIHEYFGPRLAFYFAFYEFFIKALKVAAFLGILNIILGWLNLTIWEKAVKESACEANVKKNLVCEFCEDDDLCPRRMFKEYCLSVKIHLILDHIYIPLYSIFTIVGTFIFLRLWQRREYFLKWIWEVGRQDSYYKNAVRPLFDSGLGVRTDPFIGGLQYSENIIRVFLRNVLSKVIIILYWYTIVPIMYKTYELYEEFCKQLIHDYPYDKYRDYIVMCMFQTVHVLLITGFDKIYHYIVYFIVKYENHSSYKEIEKSICIKKIAFKMVFQYSFIAYYAWLHSNHQVYGFCWYFGISLITYSSVLYYMYYLYGYTEDDVCKHSRFCAPYTCLIEITILLATILVVTQVALKMADYVFSFKTDYNQRIYIDSNIPCWEREYRLNSWTEEVMIQNYVNLAVQSSLVTWFVIAFPLAPLILYIINIWNIRYEARKLLLGSRRPLLIKTPGTKMTKVLYFIACVAVLTNAINIALITRTGVRFLTTDLMNDPTKLFYFEFFYYRCYICYAPGIFYEGDQNFIYFWDYKFSNFDRRYFFRVDYYMLSIYRFCQIILFVFAMGCSFLIIRYIFPRQREVERARATEEKIRNLYYRHEYKHSNEQHI